MYKKFYATPKYSEKHGPSIGRLIIKDLPIENANKDPLGKIWNTIQSTITELYGISVKGFFTYKSENVTVCRFYLDTKYAKAHSIDQRVYEGRFKETFSRQMLLFEEAIEKYIFATS